jgi:hypothetical protein
MTDDRVSETWWPAVSEFLANDDMEEVAIEHPCVKTISQGWGGYFLDWGGSNPEALEASEVFSRMQWVDDAFELRCVLLTLAYLKGNLGKNWL